MAVRPTEYNVVVKTTFILGAGFSADAHFPLVRDLKERVKHFVEAERHSRYRAHLRPRERCPRGRFYQGLHHTDPTGDLGFEELLLALAAERRSKQCGPCSITNWVLRIGAARLLWCITFFQFRVPVAYANFARRLSNEGGDWRIVTFNWDTLSERALQEVGAPWVYSLTAPAPSVPVIKPHGSINWSSYAQNSTLSAEYSGWRPIAPGSKLSYDSLDPLANPDFQEVHPKFRYCLFPGDPDHPDDHADLQLLWSEVKATIEQSARVVFIGYSLPSYDSYARNTLRELCASKKIEVYDPCEQTLATFQTEYPHATLERTKFRSSLYGAPPSA